MVHQHVQRLRRLLSSSETKRIEAEAKLADAEFMLAEREAELLERERVIVALQATKESLQNTLKDSMKATDTGHLARLAFEEEIALLRERSGVIQDSLESLEEDKLLRKQNEYKAKSSLLRSFRWKEKEVDPVVLQGAVAFWAATGEKVRLHRIKLSNFKRDAKNNFESHHQGRVQRRITRGVGKICC